MQYKFRKPLAAVLCALMLCTCPFLVGCNDNKGNGASEPTETAYSPTVPDNPVSPDEKGEVLEAKVGDTVNYKDKVSATLDKVVELDNSSSSSGRVLLAEMTITNNSDANIDCTILTHFTAIQNGQKNVGIVRDLSASIFARRYYVTVGSDLMPFNTPIAPGETVKGYVYMRVPVPMDELVLSYIPYKYYSNDTVNYTITEEDLEHFTQPYAPPSNNENN